VLQIWGYKSSICQHMQHGINRNWQDISLKPQEENKKLADLWPLLKPCIMRTKDTKICSNLDIKLAREGLSHLFRKNASQTREQISSNTTLNLQKVKTRHHLKGFSSNSIYVESETLDNPKERLLYMYWIMTNLNRV